jgi:hypothetical protein
MNVLRKSKYSMALQLAVSQLGRKLHDSPSHLPLGNSLSDGKAYEAALTILVRSICRTRTVPPMTCRNRSDVIVSWAMSQLYCYRLEKCLLEVGDEDRQKKRGSLRPLTCSMMKRANRVEAKVAPYCQVHQSPQYHDQRIVWVSSGEAPLILAWKRHCPNGTVLNALEWTSSGRASPSSGTTHYP